MKRKILELAKKKLVYIKKERVAFIAAIHNFTVFNGSFLNNLITKLTIFYRVLGKWEKLKKQLFAFFNLNFGR